MTMIHQTKPWLLAGLLCSLVTCSHDSKRDNPLDPALTPPVQLQVTLNDAAGTTTLTWTPYEGKTAFARYLVLRNISDRTVVDTLNVVDDLSQTSYIDSTMEANTSYRYRISVINAAGFEMPSQVASTSGYSAAAVTLFEPELDQLQGGVILRWSRFSGPRFGAYRVERFSTDLIDFEPIARFASLGDTTFTDSALVSDVSYSYRIVVEAAGSTWESNRTGRIRFSAAPVFILAVDFNGRDGTSSLAWSRYSGDQPFESYQIRRRIAGESTTEIRSTVLDEAQTSFVDTDVEVGRLYIYIVTVISTNGAELASDPFEAFFPLEPSVVLGEFDRHGLTAELSWTRAPVGFEHYEIRRRALHGGTTSIIATITDIEDTTFFDGDLEENTEYDYTVVTRSAAGREVESAAITGPILPKIAFYTNRDGQWEVYVMGADGSNPVNLTNHPAWDGPN